MRITGGQTKLQSSNDLRNNLLIPDASLLIIDSGSQLSLNNNAQIWVETIDGLSGAGAINQSNGLGQTLTLTINANNTANDALRSYSGSLGFLTGGTSVTFGGTGTQEFSGANLNYTNATALNNGILKLTDTTAWNSAITLGGSNTPKLQLNRTTGTWTLAKAITGGSANAAVEKTGAGTVVLSAVSTYNGDTTVTAGALALADNGGLKFVIGANGVNNKVTGPGTVTLDGDFTFDLSGANTTSGNTWTIVNTTTKSFTGNFTVVGFTESANIWTKVVGANTWTFKESDGTLSVASAGYSAWAATNAPTGTSSDDYDGDGVSNGLEWVLGGLATSNDLAKLPTGSTSGGNLVFTFVRNDAAWLSGDTTVQIEVGTTLASWPAVYNVGVDSASSSAGVTVTDNGTTDTVTLTVTQAPDAAKFARLKVVVTP